MPEGHTIHRIARDHREWFAGQKIGLCSPQGRFENESKRLNGRRLQDVTAHGKHLFYHWSRQAIVHVHLGLYGKFRVHRNPAPDPRGAVRVRMTGEVRSFDLNGPTCCELIDVNQYREIRDRLGQDPLNEDACPEKLWERICRNRSPIGTVLLNQSLIAGIGNVYRAEILFLLGIHPETPTSKLTREQFDALWKLTTELLSIGVKYNRIITVDHQRFDKPLSRLNSSERLNVYRKSHCRRCGTRIVTLLLGNRKIYACETCQRMNQHS